MSDTSAFDVTLQRYRKSEGKLLYVIQPDPDRPTTGRDLDLGLHFLADLILHAEAAHRALTNSDLASGKINASQALSRALRALQHPEPSAQPFIPLATVELVAMGVGSPAWIEFFLKPIRGTMFALIMGLSGTAMATAGTILIHKMDLNEQKEARQQILDNMNHILTDVTVPPSIKKDVGQKSLELVDKLESGIKLNEANIIPRLLPPDDEGRQCMRQGVGNNLRARK